MKKAIPITAVADACKNRNSTVRGRTLEIRCHSFGVRSLAAMLCVLGVGAAVENAWARPAGEQVVRGHVTFERHGNRTIIRASDGSIINYANFNIAPNELVRFIQPNEMARVLNRINSNVPTIIQGKLLANGRVYIINPAGVYFHNGAVIDVGGIYAAAGNLSNARFISGNDSFTNLRGAVVNEGAIRGKSVALIGENVANHGSIRADGGGVIAMVAGDHVVLRQHGEHLSVKVDGKVITDQARPHFGQGITADMTADPAVENTGVVSAGRGTVVLGAGDMYALAVRNSGRISAAKGDVTLAATSGLIHCTAGATINADAQSGQAGSVTIQAPSILNSGTITANSESGRAGDVEVTSQHHSYFTSSSVVSAAGGSGNAAGGDVLIHSYNGSTILAENSKVDVSGGKQGGHGGFAEISGKSLVFNGKTNLRAKRGYEKGTVLFDPHHIIITDNGGNDDLLDGNIIEFNEEPGINAYISDEALEAIVGHIILQAAGDITVEYPVDLIHFNDVTFQAKKNIYVLVPISGMRDFNAFADFDANGFGDLFLSAPLLIGRNGTFYGHNTFINTDSIKSLGYQKYLGPTDLCVDATLTATLVHFLTTLNDTIPGEQSLTVNGLNFSDGLARFDGPVGLQRMLESLRVNGSTIINGEQVVTKFFQRYLGATVIGADTTLTSTNAGRIQFGGALDGNYHLLVLTAGLTQFDGHSGGVDSLKSITTDAPGSTRVSGDMDAAVIDFNDPVALGNSVTLNGTQSVDFAQTLGGNGHSLIINSPQTGFHGDATDLDLLQTDAAGKTDIEANITGNKIDLNDPVKLLSDSTVTGHEFVDFDKTVDGPFNLVTNSNRLVRFGGDVGGDQTLKSLTTNVGSQNLVNRNLVVIDGNLIRAENNITFNPNGRNKPAEVATVAARSSGGVHIESTFGNVRMGKNEKLTSLGNLSIRAINGYALVGDLNSVGDMSVTSPDIRIRARKGGSILNFKGDFDDDAGADFVAGGTLQFSSVPTVIGSGGGAAPIFATRSGGGLSASLGGFTLRSFADLSAANFKFGQTVLDLTVPAAVRPTDLATALTEGPHRIKDHVPRDPFALRPLDRLAIYMRSLRDDELRDKLAGRELYDDAPDKAAATAEERAVAVNRLRRSSVLKVLDQYNAMFIPPASGAVEAGTAQQDQSPYIREALAKAWKSYLDREAAASAEGKLDPTGFRAFLQTHEEHRDALVYVDGLRSMFREVWIMGATRLELRNSLNTVLRPIVPENMDQAQLELAIEIES